MVCGKFQPWTIWHQFFIFKTFKQLLTYLTPRLHLVCTAPKLIIFMMDRHPCHAHPLVSFGLLIPPYDYILAVLFLQLLWRYSTKTSMAMICQHFLSCPQVSLAPLSVAVGACPNIFSTSYQKLSLCAITPQTGRGGKGPLEITGSTSPLRAGSAGAGSSGPCPVGF